MKLPSWGAVLGGALATAALSTWLFGDNIVPRAFDAVGSNSAPVEQVVASMPEPEAAPSAEPEPAKPVPNDLYNRVCAAEKMAVTYRVSKADPAKFLSRDGTTIVSVPVCYEHNRSFKTEVDNEGAFQKSGTVAGDQIDFKYEYSDGPGLVECRVVGVETNGKMKARVSCDSLGDVLLPRDAELIIVEKSPAK